MAAQSDLVRIELVALALNIGMNTARRAYLSGKIPPPDLLIRQGPRAVIHWRLSTLHAWNPGIAARCQAILTALESSPPQAA